MILLNILNFVGLSILKLFVVGLLFLNMGVALIFIAIMENLSTLLQWINSAYED